jgi:hypothetical protein
MLETTQFQERRSLPFLDIGRNPGMSELMLVDDL